MLRSKKRSVLRRRSFDSDRAERSSGPAPPSSYSCPFPFPDPPPPPPSRPIFPFTLLIIGYNPTQPIGKNANSLEALTMRDDVLLCAGDEPSHPLCPPGSAPPSHIDGAQQRLTSDWRAIIGGDKTVSLKRVRRCAASHPSRCAVDGPARSQKRRSLVMRDRPPARCRPAACSWLVGVISDLMHEEESASDAQLCCCPTRIRVFVAMGTR